MTNYTQELDKQIDNTREHADAIRATNPQRATYEDGFADGLGRAYRMVDMQSARIAELEARVKELEAWKSEARQVLTSIVANPAVQDKIEADKRTNYLIRDARALLETK